MLILGSLTATTTTTNHKMSKTLTCVNTVHIDIVLQFPRLLIESQMIPLFDTFYYDYIHVEDPGIHKNKCNPTLKDYLFAGQTWNMKPNYELFHFYLDLGLPKPWELCGKIFYS